MTLSDLRKFTFKIINVDRMDVLGWNQMVII